MRATLEGHTALANLMGCECGYIKKARNPVTNEVSATASFKNDLSGKDAIIFDDIISTGGTIELAANMAKANGARKIVAAATHLVMSGNAEGRLRKAGIEEIYGTNTIPYPGARMIDISDEIARGLG